MEAADAGVHVMDAVQDQEDGRVFSIVPHGTLPPATYTVSWRGMSEDGHVVRETFDFTVAAW
ncbi:MAG: copper resistance protein CopC [Gemmatimonadota bacterium]|nr:copper resistance protein CopC [Gemmatimonadota bacterium]MDE3004875.1 copper resistance protein CopC [Gemmatimonadota bacterium]MDE3014932.1 copper resistance protein CopC [Gemmatimonadota bacterium]